MAKNKKIEFGAINITTHPHSPEMYLKLFRAARRLESSARLRGDQFGRIGLIKKLDDDQKEPGPIEGEILKFTDIDIEGEWFNVKSKSVATEDDMADIYIPENLKPNLSRFSFIFFPLEHILIYEGYYDGKTLSPTLAETFFEKTLNHPAIKKKFGPVFVTHIPEANIIDRMLSLRGITNLTLTTKRPNPDDLRTTERKVHDRLKRWNASQEERSLKAIDGDELHLDKELKLEAKVAAKNGIVELKHYNHEGVKETLSTKDHPMRRTEYYNPDSVLSFEILREMAFNLKKEISAWMKT
ncbi:DUF4747 family protein [Aeromonas hydrophila]|uniref:DUF4747 family protein n=1 Tax=Aeromonas hydrophila TaxID=644 RepID=UPI0014553092|nr:DUF4747 family protein [Aeromonas hydrophila]NLR37332.1 DUF4747 family protein [Aeromonas hydrophila]